LSKRTAGLLLLLFWGSVASAPGRSPSAGTPPRYLADDPLWHDPDNLPSPLPEERDLSQLYDFIINTFFLRPGGDEEIPEAANVNTLDEVPDSSWFTNRIGRKTLSLEELVRGPDQSGGPDPSGPWTVIAGKTQGITPGFRIRDARGDVYFMKFDPRGHPQLATSSEVIATAFFHAFGYYVPENYLVFVRKEQFTIAAEATLTDQEGKKRSFTEQDLEQIFRRVEHLPDGTVPALASLRLDGRPIGPFEYWDVRSDDLNDVFPHQHRRELRGLRLFAAWLNHDDSRSINTLDMYLGEPGAGHVRHHLIDFGSCFGSGSVKVQSRRAGNEYILEWGPILKAAVTLGIWDRPWRRVRYPNYPSIGRFEAEFFQPERWKPEYPNPAFERMKARDAFWAAKIIAKFSDEAVGALVEKGRLLNPEAAAYLTDTLLRRRDKILRRYLPAVAPFDEFEVVGRSGDRSIGFADLASRHRVLEPSSYTYAWYRYDNCRDTSDPLEAVGVVDSPSVPLPPDDAPFLRLELTRNGTGHRADVYLRQEAGEYRVVGVERHSRQDRDDR